MDVGSAGAPSGSDLKVCIYTLYFDFVLNNKNNNNNNHNENV